MELSITSRGITMKGLMLLAALFLSMSANATLISYSYDNTIANPQGSHSAVGIFTVDDQNRGLVSATFESEPASFEWEGFAPLLHDQPVSDEGGLFENGFEPFVSGDFEFFLFLDLFFLEAGQDIFHNLDKTAPFEGAGVTVLSTGETYYLTGGLTKLQTIDIPEPSTLALLGPVLISLVLSGLLKGGAQQDEGTTPASK
ncbi:hypothetical protein [Marinobacter sp. HN1S83]|uniref:hypothetical protein n=1 Tax=unclassified Marinobacter TaxID=83889 RepID=UPI00387B072A